MNHSSSQARRSASVVPGGIGFVSAVAVAVAVTVDDVAAVSTGVVVAVAVDAETSKVEDEVTTGAMVVSTRGVSEL